MVRRRGATCICSIALSPKWTAWGLFHYSAPFGPLRRRAMCARRRPRSWLKKAWNAAQIRSNQNLKWRCSRTALERNFNFMRGHCLSKWRYCEPSRRGQRSCNLVLRGRLLPEFCTPTAADGARIFRVGAEILRDWRLWHCAKQAAPWDTAFKRFRNLFLLVQVGVRGVKLFSQVWTPSPPQAPRKFPTVRRTW